MLNKANKQNNAQFGRAGEQQAADYLRKKGYQIIQQNYRWARGEIDIIARDEKTLVFVEVKTTRNASTFGEPETWVTLRKQQQIGQVASRFLQEFEIKDVDCRFDVVAVTYSNQSWHLKHIENAFWLS
ncbi:YraN family protein [candidate division KSB1 bacterium]|nr:YraN family protein [candidate division KSB1 bacterium]